MLWKIITALEASMLITMLPRPQLINAFKNISSSTIHYASIKLSSYFKQLLKPTFSIDFSLFYNSSSIIKDTYDKTAGTLRCNIQKQYNISRNNRENVTAHISIIYVYQWWFIKNDSIKLSSFVLTSNIVITRDINNIFQVNWELGENV